MALRNPDDKGEAPSGDLLGVILVFIIGSMVVFGLGIVVVSSVIYGGTVGAIVVAIFGGKATCNGCGEKVDRKLFTCSNCGTLVRYHLGTTPQELTPSDLVVLEIMPRSNEELHGVVRVQVDGEPSFGIGRLLLATALLANEAVGALRLEVVKERVVAVRVSNPHQWPAGSLERSLDKRGAVSDIIYDWIGTTSNDPERQAVVQIMAMMVHRTLLELEVDKKRVLNLFTMSKRYYVLPERTSALDMQRSVRLLEECQRTRPDVHDQLTKDIEIGFARRTNEPSE